MSRRATIAVLAGLALALSAGIVATAKPATERSPALAEQLASARLATAKYATDLDRAKTDGYRTITRMIPYMGWHFMNASIKEFDVRRPAILVYERKGRAWQLAAAEWVFTKSPATPPLPGARYGSFPAACHYADGTFTPTVRGSLPAHEPPDGRGVRVLAPGPRDHARMAVVPEPRRAVRELQPPRQAVQQ
jgi:hypothetical protein